MNEWLFARADATCEGESGVERAPPTSPSLDLTEQEIEELLDLGRLCGPPSGARTEWPAACYLVGTGARKEENPCELDETADRSS